MIRKVDTDQSTEMENVSSIATIYSKSIGPVAKRLKELELFVSVNEKGPKRDGKDWEVAVDSECRYDVLVMQTSRLVSLIATVTCQ